MPIEAAPIEAAPAAWLAGWSPVGAHRAAPDARPEGAAQRLLLTAPGGNPTVRQAADGPRTLVFDGLLYNQAELRERLGDQAPPGDPELVLAAYRRWGCEAFATLRGLFALVLWDDARRTLWCVRDPLGVMPLFYAQAGRTLLLAPALEPLLAQPGVAHTLNRPALADHLCGRWSRPDETYYAAIRRVLPGHYLRVDAGGTTTARYWHALPPAGAINWVREGDLGEFETLFARAVDRCLSLGPAGIWLSGGLDSTRVAIAAAESRRPPGQPAPWALSLIFPDPECNEERIQQGVAGGLGLPQLCVPVEEAAGGADMLAAALAMSAGGPAPLENIFLPAYGYLARAGRDRGCRVLLTGGGGDETLAVGPLYGADLLRAGNLAGLYRLWRSYQGAYPAPAGQIAREVVWAFGLQAVLSNGAGRALRHLAPGAYRRRRRAQARARVPAWVAPDPALRRVVRARIAGSLRPPARGSLYVDEARHELDQAKATIDQEELFAFGRQQGVRVLQPFWDADLVAFLYRTPPELLNRGGRAKGLIRGPVAHRFPDLGFADQRKVNSVDFFAHVVVGGGPDAWGQLGGTPALAQLGLVDPRALDSILAPVRAGADPRHAYELWNVLRLEAWLQPRV